MDNNSCFSPPLNDACVQDSSLANTVDQPVDTTRLHSTGEAISISIVSHSRLLREGLATLLAPYLTVRLVGSYTGNIQLDEWMPNPQGHVVLIDTGIGRDAAGLWTRWWRAQPAPPPVLLLEVEDNQEVILAYIELGASGYTLKEAPPAEVAQALVRASHGLAHCSEAMTAFLFARLATVSTQLVLPPVALNPLTTREMDVLRCIAQGMSNKEVANQLIIEIHTVKHHVHNILEKMSLHHRFEAVRFAAEQGWVEEPARDRALVVPN